MIRIPLEWLEFAFEWLDSLSNVSNLLLSGLDPVFFDDSNLHSNFVGMV